MILQIRLMGIIYLDEMYAVIHLQQKLVGIVDVTRIDDASVVIE